MDNTAAVALIILFLPLAGAALIAFAGPYLPRAVCAGIAVTSLLLGWVLTLVLAWPWHAGTGTTYDLTYGTWFVVPQLKITFGLLIDPLSITWMRVITGVGFLIHLYSVGYMASDRNYRTFFAYMNLFVFTMLLLVMADNFLWLLVGWGGVGLASYLLIGFYYDRVSAVLAARKALIMNVIGDVGIMIAIFLMYAHFGSAAYGDVFSRAASIGAPALTAIGLWLLLGAVAKSAQLPLHTWLPDAMEGPTPVSALIHAATMVTAGVYLIARCYPIYDNAPVAAEWVAIIGATSALFAATIGCVQYDIKRVLAYSTMSQIGYMMFAVGAGAYAAGAFHFLTHAFFKALLFMAAGIVIHNLGGEQDIRKMGGLARAMPLAFWTFLIGTAAIAGVPPLSGFFSKDAIIDAAIALHHPVLGAFLIVAAFLTAFYMFRLLFLTFFSGRYRGEGTPHDHPVASMNVPVVLLAALAAVGGFLAWPLQPMLRAVFVGTPHEQTIASIDWPVAGGAFLLVVAGIATAYALYQVRPQLRESLIRALAGPRELVMNAYYLDTVYHWLVEVPAYAIADAAAGFFERYVIRAIPLAASGTAAALGGFARAWESGQLRRYGLTIAVGVVLLLAWYVIAAYAASSQGVVPR
ncbi:MAG TPA: NADH-quinone oxidoreductase subunit L [Candidatus Eremiobacteraceae bacterium]|nr:NADH-quinone oxidoreductase subunit L [Candidatus Eremiobacteraceae bacterium]